MICDKCGGTGKNQNGTMLEHMSTWTTNTQSWEDFLKMNCPRCDGRGVVE